MSTVRAMKMSSFSRRKFIFAAACASWTFHSFPTRCGAAPRTVGLGFSLYGMKTIGLGAALKALAEIGYDCVELPVMEGWPGDSAKLARADRDALRGQLAERGMRLGALMENLPALGDEAHHQANLGRLARACELAHDLEPAKKADAAPSSPIIETILGGKAGEFEAVKESLVKRLQDWEKVAAAARVTLAVKAHIGNATQRTEQLKWLLEQIASPWLKAAYDYSHFQLQNLTIKETLEAMLPMSAFIHVKDTEQAAGKRGFLLPGEGTIDYLEMFKLLKQSSYGGDVVVEVSSQVSNRAGYDPFAAASKCYNHLADAFSKTGLPRG